MPQQAHRHHLARVGVDDDEYPVGGIDPVQNSGVSIRIIRAGCTIVVSDHVHGGIIAKIRIARSESNVWIYTRQGAVVRIDADIEVSKADDAQLIRCRIEIGPVKR